MQWTCEINKRASATCHTESRRRRVSSNALVISLGILRDQRSRRRDPSLALGMTANLSRTRQLQTQSSWNQNAIEQIEKELHQQRQQRRRNCAFQDRDMIVQIQSTDNWFA